MHSMEPQHGLRHIGRKSLGQAGAPSSGGLTPRGPHDFVHRQVGIQGVGQELLSPHLGTGITQLNYAHFVPTSNPIPHTQADTGIYASWIISSLSVVAQIFSLYLRSLHS